MREISIDTATIEERLFGSKLRLLDISISIHEEGRQFIYPLLSPICAFKYDDNGFAPFIISNIRVAGRV